MIIVMQSTNVQSGQQKGEGLLKLKKKKEKKEV